MCVASRVPAVGQYTPGLSCCSPSLQLQFLVATKFALESGLVYILFVIDVP